ncbi:hydrolase (plasmid) [Sphingopyxis fribergensis]|uniref:Hydrolase n=2 Tax=Sphingomonadaceae TaxID=41297 RepID=A0A0A7PR43_9SPHN|nr:MULTISPECIES: alpha/beta hydrolase [Sphingomonadaceae]AJA11723.1 hydrolase [Sphingopyxis fribergensis]MCW1384655.1 alpha/beta hydrolase [Novosphingobium sp. KCTC 2891]
MSSDITNGLGDIDPEWAPNPEELPRWFVDALAVPRDEGFVEVDGTRIHYFRWGRRGAPPVLMTHGFLAHARCFAFIAPFLAKDYDVVAYDLSAMGDSAVRENCDLAARGREMIGVARALGLFDGAPKPAIVAHSFGASVALEALEQLPGGFAGAAICDMMTLRPAMLEAFWAGGHTSPGSGNPDKPLRIYPDFATARGRYKLSPPQQVGEPFLFDYMAYHSLRRVEGGWSWKFSPAVFKRDNARTDWLTIGTKLVAAPGRKAIIHGEESLLFTRDSRDFVHDLGGKDIQIIAVPGARHHLMLDQPLAFVTAVRALLAQWHEAASD